MKNKILLVVLTITLCLLGSLPSFSQAPDPSKLNIVSAQQSLQDIRINNFEDAAFWSVIMPQDQGSITIRRLPGFPGQKEILDKERIETEKALGFPVGGYVLGVKVEFYKRGMNYFHIYPIQPIAMEGLVKTFSIWVIGRNYNHVLKVLVGDYFGTYKELTLGKLNFSGWKKLTVAIPPQITQTDYHYSYKSGLKLLGFKVECDLIETYGSYYIYFDDASVVTDLFQSTSKDADDMPDQW
jgi:hypothetical protein